MSANKTVMQCSSQHMHFSRMFHKASLPASHFCWSITTVGKNFPCRWLAASLFLTDSLGGFFSGFLSSRSIQQLLEPVAIEVKMCTPCSCFLARLARSTENSPGVNCELCSFFFKTYFCLAVLEGLSHLSPFIRFYNWVIPFCILVNYIYIDTYIFIISSFLDRTWACGWECGIHFFPLNLDVDFLRPKLGWNLPSSDTPRRLHNCSL